jgi:hypothetical protein
MRQLKFGPGLPELILSGKKYATWRLADDAIVNDIQVGDTFVCAGGGKEFATAKVNSIKVVSFADMTEEDKLGHETYPTEEQKYATFSDYYDTVVGPNTMIKIIKFELV